MQAFLASWFESLEGGDAPDAALANHWRELIQQAANGELDDWQSTPPGMLALILLFTLVPKRLGLPSPERWQFKARALCISGIRRGFDTQLDLCGRYGFYAPLFHSRLDEDKLLLSRLLGGMRALAADTDPELCRLAQWRGWWLQAGFDLSVEGLQDLG
ncbi:DUF924 family protein [Shewanella sp.]|uniref:DUF924 family protein n=1 Tax=Shewanella sp. TaxID=50422 RepID=UPI00356180B7